MFSTIIFWGANSSIADLSDYTKKYYTDLVQKETQKYEMAKRENDNVSACWAASSVASAYLELLDESNYSRWKRIQEDTCQEAWK